MSTPTARWLVRFGYDGSGFAGWARQPGLRTVEGVLRAGLVDAGIAPSAEAARPDVASRTDRGVHAVGNAVAISTELPIEACLRALNGIDPQIFFTRARRVAEEFRPRQATSRTYLYFEPVAGHRLTRLRAGARILQGPVDARSFGRGMPALGPTFREIERIRITRSGEMLTIEVTARSFVWGMVRKIVAGLREFDAGRLDADALEAAARGRRRLTLPMAEADGLVLGEVSYPDPWEVHAAGPSRRQLAVRSAALRSASVRSAVVAALADITG